MVVRNFRFADAQEGTSAATAASGPDTDVGKIVVEIWRCVTGDPAA